jgi:hypothetical protein
MKSWRDDSDPVLTPEKGQAWEGLSKRFTIGDIDIFFIIVHSAIFYLSEQHAKLTKRPKSCIVKLAINCE